MKLCLFFVSLFFNQMDSTKTLSIIMLRDLYEKAPKTEQANVALTSLIHLSGNKSPLYQGYKGATNMIQAKYVFNPISKWNRFKKGKKLIEEAINKESSNYELRYLRLTLQSNLPAFLGYYNEITEDKNLLIENLNQLPDADLRYRIINYLLLAKICTAIELEKLKTWQNK